MTRILLLASAAFLSACASSADLVSEMEDRFADPRMGERVNEICFPRGLDQFRDNRDRTVIVRRGVDDDYLLKLRSCPQLDDAQAIILPNRPTSACLSQYDAIVVSESVFDTRGPAQVGPSTCFIDAIYRWDEQAADEIEPTAEAG